MSRATTSVTLTGCDTRLRAIARGGGVLYVYERLRVVGRHGERAWCIVRVDIATRCEGAA